MPQDTTTILRNVRTLEHILDLEFDYLWCRSGAAARQKQYATASNILGQLQEVEEARTFLQAARRLAVAH
ncbi:MAG: hypothetical protein AB7P40_19320 [Chloroflexota bacterium]